MRLIDGDKLKQSLIEAGATISILNALDATPDAIAEAVKDHGPLEMIPTGITYKRIGVSDELAWMHFATTSIALMTVYDHATFADLMLTEFRQRFPRDKT